MLASRPNAVRAVFYLDIKDSDVEHASELVGEALQHLERQPGETRLATAAQYCRRLLIEPSGEWRLSCLGVEWRRAAQELAAGICGHR